MERLSDEELKEIIVAWRQAPAAPDWNFDRETQELVDAIREAERRKGEATVNGCAECAKNLYHVFSHPKPTPYADKVLEVAGLIVGHLIASPRSIAWEGRRLEKVSDYAMVAVEQAEALITAANEAARKREERS